MTFVTEDRKTAQESTFPNTYTFDLFGGVHVSLQLCALDQLNMYLYKAVQGNAAGKLNPPLCSSYAVNFSHLHDKNCRNMHSEANYLKSLFVSNSGQVHFLNCF